MCKIGQFEVYTQEIPFVCPDLSGCECSSKYDGIFFRCDIQGEMSNKVRILGLKNGKKWVLDIVQTRSSIQIHRENANYLLPQSPWSSYYPVSTNS